jgi:release factor glutamine methyltransferase
MAVLADTLKTTVPRLADTLALEGREARLEGQILAAHALGVNRAWLIAHDRDELTPAQAKAVEALIARREHGEPVAYILAEKEFYGRMFKVTPDVLIPRPETELLVEAALERLPKDLPARVLDLGTGSGCIAISIALERPLAEVQAVEASAEALAVAQTNAGRLGANNVHCRGGDWHGKLGVNKFDMIVSNPPYIAADDRHLDAGDLRFEPRQALTGGGDGLHDLRAIIASAPAHLEARGWILLEHGWDQAAAVQALLHQHGFEQILSLNDLAGLNRVSGGRWPGGGG